MSQFLKFRLLTLLLGCCALSAFSPLRAETKAETKTEAREDATVVAAIRDLLIRTQPGIDITSVKASPLAGLYEVVVSGGQTVYVSADAKYLIPGDLYEAQKDGLVNLGEGHRAKFRRDRIAAVDQKDMIIFAAKGKRKATLTVFTDVDCPYCRKLHGEIDRLNELGIEVHYLAYPRTGLKGETYEKMISTWCADDRKAVFTAAKRGGDIPVLKCDSPVEEEFEIGQQIGVTGTPALVFEDGTMLPGYVPADTLAGYLFGDAAK